VIWMEKPIKEPIVLEKKTRRYVIYYDSKGLLTIDVYQKLGDRFILVKSRSLRNEGAARFIRFMYYLAYEFKKPEIRQLPLFIEK